MDTSLNMFFMCVRECVCQCVGVLIEGYVSVSTPFVLLE